MFLSGIKKIISTLSLIFLLTGLTASAANNASYYSGAYNLANFKVDSLRTLLASTLANKDNPTDTVTINRINKLASEFIDVNPDSTLYYGKMAIGRSLAIKYKKGIADGMLSTARVYVSKGDYDKAKENFTGAKLLYVNMKNQASLGSCYIEIGRMYNNLADYELASGYFKQALDIFKWLKDENGIAKSYHNMGMVSDNIGKSSYALDNYFKSLSLNIKLHDRVSSAADYNNIGEEMKEMEIYPKAMEYYKRAVKIWEESKNVMGVSTAYENIGEILMAEKKYDQALVYLNKSMKLTREMDDKNGLSLLASDFGLCYAYKQQYDVALNYLAEALKIANDSKIDYNKAVAYINYATVYNMQKDYQKAYKYALQAQDLANKLGSLSNRTNATLQLSESLGGLGRFQEAFKEQKVYNGLKDSLKSDESVQKLTSYNLESDFAEKQRLLAAQHQRQDDLYQQKIQRQGLLSAIFFIIILGMAAVLIVYYRSKRKQQKINTILEDKNIEVIKQKGDLNDQAQKLNDLNNLKDRLISVLAHDLRAPLSTLRGLFSLLVDDTISHEQFLEMIPQSLKKLEYTSDFLDTLLFWINSQMENFDSSAKSFPIKDVVSYEVSNYHEQALEKGIRLVDKVSKNMTVAADPNSVRIVTRNLITNAIKFSRRDDTITITAHYQDDNYLLLSIKDTGVGMSEKQLNKLFKSKVDSGTGTNNESGTGMGLLFCKDLIEKCNGKIWVESTLGQGTEFFFTLPVGTIGTVKEEEHALAS
ncbi:tetratricopeptide repeat-containing sensor histidine kinase [Mucilaginibacter sp. McL0603]|uniref:tetratricopeptide repeat-containing sensor histidine kinase n=1 Tax=Mucilaginibacter sp. McL0603 TaxID=3415670 RepID=UPI003CF21967